MELTQILLFSVVSVLTLLLVAVGIQVLFILRDMRKTLKKVNKILEDANMISHSVAKPVAGVVSFVEGLKGMRGLMDLVSGRTDDKPEKKAQHKAPEPPPVRVEELKPDDNVDVQIHTPHSHIHALQERGRRFFHKGGKPLSS